MVLQSLLITDLNEVLGIINNISDSDRCSGEDDSASDDYIISPMSEHSMINRETTTVDNCHSSVTSTISFILVDRLASVYI